MDHLRALVISACLLAFGVAAEVVMAEPTGTVRVKVEGAATKAFGIKMLNALVENPDKGRSYILKMVKGGFAGQVPPGRYTLLLAVGSNISFEADAGTVEVKAGRETKRTVTLGDYFATLRVTAPDKAARALLKDTTLWFYATDRAGYPFAKVRVPKDGRIGAVPATHMRLVLRNEAGAALYEERVNLLPGEQWNMTVKARDMKKNYPLRVWIKTRPPQADPPADLKVEFFDGSGKKGAGKRAVAKARRETGKFSATLPPSLYRIQVSYGSVRYTKEAYVGDRKGPTDVVLVFERSVQGGKVNYSSVFCSSERVAIARENYIKGRRAETSGRVIDALFFYSGANLCNINDWAGEMIKRIGREEATKAESKKNFYSGAETYVLRPDKRCLRSGAVIPIVIDIAEEKRYFIKNYQHDVYDPGVACSGDKRMVVNAKAGAFDWLTATGNPREADRVMLRYARTIPADKAKDFKAPLGHFRKGKDAKALAKLKDVASSHVDGFLRKEPGAFNKKEVIGGFSPEKRSLNLLKRAGKWASYFGGSHLEKIKGRAVKRGDVLYKDDAFPSSLEYAVSFYRLAKDEGRIKKVRVKADRLGEKSAVRGRISKARKYFRIAGNDARADEMARLLKREEKKEKKKMHRTEEQKKDFRKGTKELEKEFGF